MAHLKLGTRKSPLALWQAEYVAAELMKRDPDVTVELVTMSTRGDRILDAPLAKVGGKGLFVKEIEEALLRKEIDLAVHSLKDMPARQPKGLIMAAYPPRADPRDAWVCPSGAAIRDLPRGARVGTSSLRRQCQLLSVRPDLQVVSIRGSVETRLNKLQTEHLDAVVLAAAGLERLGLDARISRRLETTEMLPAVGQGILAVEVRDDDDHTLSRVRALEDADARRAAECERAMLAELGGGCQVPIAGYAVRDGKSWWLRGLVARPDGTSVIRSEGRISGDADDAALRRLGRDVAEELLHNGAAPILQELGLRTDEE